MSQLADAEEVRRLTLEAFQQGSNHCKMKVSITVKSDLPRAKVSSP